MVIADTQDERPRAALPAPGPGRHGEAALLLVESLIHELIARQCLTVPIAMSVVDIAATAQMQLNDEPRGGARDPADMLHAISASLATELFEVSGPS